MKYRYQGIVDASLECQTIPGKYMIEISHIFYLRSNSALININFLRVSLATL